MDYIAYLHKDRDSDYGVSFPDFPGAVTAGKTLEEAHRMAAEVLELHIDGMIEDGDAIPEPSTLDDLADDPALKGALAFLVHVDPKIDRTVRINITAREKQVVLIDLAAEAAGMTRSAFMVQSVLKSVQSVLRTEPADPGLEEVRLALLQSVAARLHAGSSHPEVAPSDDVETAAARRLPPKRPHAAKH